MRSILRFHREDGAATPSSRSFRIQMNTVDLTSQLKNARASVDEAKRKLADIAMNGASDEDIFIQKCAYENSVELVNTLTERIVAILNNRSNSDSTVLPDNPGKEENEG